MWKPKEIGYLLVFLIFLLFAAVVFISLDLLFGWKAVVCSNWIIPALTFVPPIWFAFEHFCWMIITDDDIKAKKFETFTHGQDIARNIWLAYLGFIIALQSTPSTYCEPVKKIVVNIQEISVYFEYDKSTMTEGAKSFLQSILKESQDSSNISEINISCYADKKGSKSYNQKLSHDRCESVNKFLINQISSEIKIKRKTFGENDSKFRTDDGIREPGSRRVSLQILRLNTNNPEIR